MRLAHPLNAAEGLEALASAGAERLSRRRKKRGGDGGGKELGLGAGDVWEHLGDEVRWLRAWAGRLVGVVGVAALAVCAKCPGAVDRELVLLLWGGAGGIVFLLTAMVLFNKDRARDPQPETGRLIALPQ